MEIVPFFDVPQISIRKYNLKIVYSDFVLYVPDDVMHTFVKDWPIKFLCELMVLWWSYGNNNNNKKDNNEPFVICE